MRQVLTKWIDTLILSTTNNNKNKIQVSKQFKKTSKKIDFLRDKVFVPGIVSSICYSPKTTSKTCIVKYNDGESRRMLVPNGLNVGNIVFSGIELPISIGNHLLLKNLPLGTDIHNVELYPGCGGKLARAGGTFVNVVAKEGLYVTLRLPSGEVRFVSKYCWASIGRIGEKNNRKSSLYKAGQNRWVGIRPHVRGVVKNPVDHPHGGGEGRSPIGRSHPVTPWGRIALGQRTRKSKKYSDLLILIRRK